MIIEVLLLGACAGLGLSSDVKNYGDTYRMRVLRKTESIEFSPMYDSDVTVLWKHDAPLAGEDSRRKAMGGYYVISNLTQRDSGKYVMRDKNQRELSTKTLEVHANERIHERSTGESISISFFLEPKSCNIYFVPGSDHPQTDTQIVRRGWPQNNINNVCKGFNLLKPCGISNDYLQYSCRGQFEVRDNNDDTALRVFLEVEPPPTTEINPSQIGFGVGAFLSALSCCCCLRRCCCGKSSDKKDNPETPDAEPVVNDNEPVEPGSHQLSQPSRTHYPAQPSRTHYPAQPSYTAIDPLIHDPPPMNELPPYSEVSAPAEQADAPTVPVLSDPEPRFELKGMAFPSAPPLNSDSTYSSVYNSDKLNFA